MLSPVRRYGWVAALVLGMAVVWGSAQSVSGATVSRSVKITPTIKGETLEWTDSAGGAGCSWVHVIEFSEVPGATSYQFQVKDAAFGGAVRSLTGTPPSFEDGNFRNGAASKAPPAGRHWVGLSGGSASGGTAAELLPACTASAAGAASRYQLVDAVALVNVDPDKGAVAGRVVETTCGEASCSETPLAGVKVSAGSASASTGADGSYRIEVEPGSYVVRPSAPGRTFDPTSRTVRVTKGATANAAFRTCAAPKASQAISHELTSTCKTAISGTVLKEACAPGSKPCDLELRPVASRKVELAASDGSRRLTTTDRRGEYRFEVAAGTYTLRLPGAGKRVDPVSRTVQVGSTSVTGADFMLCEPPPGARTKTGCGVVRIEGTAVDLDGQPFAEVDLEVVGGRATAATRTTTSTSGAFTLFLSGAPAGTSANILVVGEGDSVVSPNGERRVRIPKGVRVLRGVTVRVEPAFEVRMGTAELVVIAAAGIPVKSRGLVEVEFATRESGVCRRDAVLPVHKAGSSVGASRLRPFCDGQWTATLVAAGDRVLGRLRVLVPASGRLVEAVTPRR